MPSITLDGIRYNTEDLTERGRAQLASLQFLETNLKKLKNEISVYQTAQASYVAALKAEIEKSGIEPTKEKDESSGLDKP